MTPTKANLADKFGAVTNRSIREIDVLTSASAATISRASVL